MDDTTDQLKAIIEENEDSESTKCCCGKHDLPADSQHFCSNTKKPVVPWCIESEGYGSSGLCEGCRVQQEVPATTSNNGFKMPEPASAKDNSSSSPTMYLKDLKDFKSLLGRLCYTTGYTESFKYDDTVKTLFTYAHVKIGLAKSNPLNTLIVWN